MYCSANNPAFEEWLLGEGNLKRKYPLTELYSALGHTTLQRRSLSTTCSGYFAASSSFIFRE